MWGGSWMCRSRGDRGIGRRCRDLVSGRAGWGGHWMCRSRGDRGIGRRFRNLVSGRLG